MPASLWIHFASYVSNSLHSYNKCVEKKREMQNIRYMYIVHVSKLKTIENPQKIYKWLKIRIRY